MSGDFDSKFSALMVLLNPKFSFNEADQAFIENALISVKLDQPEIKLTFGCIDQKTPTDIQKKGNSDPYPSWKIMIIKAIFDKKKTNGCCSRQMIVKYITANYPVEDSVLKVQLTLALRLLVKDGILEKIKQSYKLSPIYNIWI
jgi:hypothetical protein